VDETDGDANPGPDHEPHECALAQRALVPWAVAGAYKYLATYSRNCYSNTYVLSQAGRTKKNPNRVFLVASLGRIAPEPKHKVPYSHSDEAPGGSVPGILPVYIVNLGGFGPAHFFFKLKIQSFTIPVFMHRGRTEQHGKRRVYLQGIHAHV
jgi:hypothetical protein